MRLTVLIAGLFAIAIISGASISTVNAQNKKPTIATKKTVASVTTPTEAAPSVTHIIVTVKSGDYLSKIATEHNTNYKRLYDANPSIQDPNKIYPGNTIRIPAQDEVIPSRALPVAQVSAPVTTAPAPKKQTATAPSPKPAPAPAPAAAAPKPSPKPAPAPVAAPANTTSAGVWDRLAQCEATGNWSINTGNGYYGGLQFSLASWRAVGGSGYPHQASKAEQIARGEMLLKKQGWKAWPACSAKLGLR
jgi:LysM repeat protein